MFWTSILLQVGSCGTRFHEDSGGRVSTILRKHVQIALVHGGNTDGNAGWEFMSHLADLVEGVLPVTSSVFEVVMSRKRPVDVPGDGAVLRGLLTETHKNLA